MCLLKCLLLSLAEAGQLVDEVGLCPRDRHTRCEIFEEFELTVPVTTITILKFIFQITQVRLLLHLALQEGLFFRLRFPLLLLSFVLESLR